MKILFHDYSDQLCTEPLYLNMALQQCGIQSALWSDPKMSAFDVLDQAQPDVLVASRLTVTQDIMKYLRQHPNIELVLNITDIKPNQMNALESALKADRIKVPFCFSNNFGYKKIPDMGIKCHRIYPAADLFNVHPPVEPILDECIISNKFSQSLENYIADKDVYHLLYLAQDNLIPPFDLRGNVRSCPQLYKSYRKITVFGDTDFCSSQLFFDINLQAHRAAFYTTDEDQTGWGGVLSTCFTEPDAGDRYWEEENIQPVIKGQIKSRHTPFHRAWTLMKHLKNQEGMQAVDTVKNQLTSSLKDL